jgi:hypothetical protein
LDDRRRELERTRLPHPQLSAFPLAVVVIGKRTLHQLGLVAKTHKQAFQQSKEACSSRTLVSNLDDCHAK